MKIKTDKHLLLVCKPKSTSSNFKDEDYWEQDSECSNHAVVLLDCTTATKKCNNEDNDPNDYQENSSIGILVISKRQIVTKFAPDNCSNYDESKPTQLYERKTGIINDKLQLFNAKNMLWSFNSIQGKSHLIGHNKTHGNHLQSHSKSLLINYRQCCLNFLKVSNNQCEIYRKSLAHCNFRGKNLWVRSHRHGEENFEQWEGHSMITIASNYLGICLLMLGSKDDKEKYC